MFIIILLFAFSSMLSAGTKNSEKYLLLKKADKDILIDGVIDPTWNSADSTATFFQLSPYYAKEPSKRTVAKVLTTEDAIYCLMINYDTRSNIQSNAGILDQFGSSDIVSFMIDTFNDKKTSYKFAVTAAGVKLDCRLLDDGRNRDYNWDGIWFADSKVYDWGFVVEMKIPYKSIQYNEAESWGLDFDRWMSKISEDLYWCEYEQNEGQRISKFGRLVFNDFKPTVKGLNLELYPLAISKITYLPDGKYKNDPNAGLDILYNPSPKLTYQLTVNPDFAQIEADPFQFNISRYETYFSERRPFFTQGNEIFMPAGKQQNSGFYSPMELFYSRRIGKKLPGGNEVPLIFGTKAFGRINDWEYGGFLAMTGETDYVDNNGGNQREERAYFGSARVKKQILDNSNIGILFVGKNSVGNNSGVLDVDGAFRESDWQLAYQVARSFKNSEGDFALSAGFTKFSPKWMTLIRTRYVGNKFDINDVGYVPWKGTGTFVGITGPNWYYDEGYIAQLQIYGGGAFTYEKVDAYTDYSGILGINMQLRDNWGYEIDYSFGNQKDSDVKYFASELTFSSWFNISPKWNGNLYGGYTKTYNFSRNYLASYSWAGTYFQWKALSIMDIGTSYDMFIEGNPEGNVEEITYNARPFVTLTPINDLRVRLYLDNVFVKSSDKLEQVIFGFLFSYNFSPKSWIYFAVNEIRDRSQQFDPSGNILPASMHVVDRVGVFKIKYLYYF
ncbi:MAG: DUF5916 domain-containing protein [Ignavibacteriaceae bacterium]|jgi:hypothetical protein